MSTPIQDFNGVPGLVVDPSGGSVTPAMAGVASVPDCLALTASTLLKMRDAMLEIPNIGDWSTYGAADVGLLQLFPNADRLRNTEIRRQSADIVMGWLKGEWRVVNHTSRAAKVMVGERECIVMLHHVDGAVISEPEKQEGTAHA